MFKIKQIPQDFIVKEISKLNSVNNGEYAFYCLKKINFTTVDALIALSRKFKVPLKNFGFAGNKDKNAVTEQFISIFRGSKVYEKIKLKNIELKYIANGKEQISLGGMIYHKQKMLELVVDFFVISASYIGAYLLRYEGALAPVNMNLILNSLPLIIIIKLSSFYWFGLYRGVWQYVGLHDLFSVIKAVTIGCVASIIALVFIFHIEGYSRAVFIIDWLILLISASGVRIAMRMFREYFNFDAAGGKRIFIMGAGDAGEYFLRGLRYNKKLKYTPIGFIDDDTEKRGRKIHGVPILGTRNDIAGLAKKHSVSEMFIAIPSLDDISIKEITDICQKSGVLCREMSDVVLW